MAQSTQSGQEHHSGGGGGQRGDDPCSNCDSPTVAPRSQNSTHMPVFLAEETLSRQPGQRYPTPNLLERLPLLSPLPSRPSPAPHASPCPSPTPLPAPPPSLWHWSVLPISSFWVCRRAGPGACRGDLQALWFCMEWPHAQRHILQSGEGPLGGQGCASRPCHQLGLSVKAPVLPAVSLAGAGLGLG